MPPPLSGQDEASLFEQEMRLSVSQLKQQNADIIALLKGNNNNPYDKGVLGELHDISAKVSKHDNFIKSLKWVSIGAGITSGYGIFEFIRKLINHS